MLRWVVGDFLTGLIRRDITSAVMDGSWAAQLNASAPITAKINADAFYDRRSNTRTPIRSETAPWRAFLGCIDMADDRVLAAGPITGRPWDDTGRSVDLNAGGFWSYPMRRVLIPPYNSGRITSLVTKFVQDDGLALPDIAVELMRQMLTHPNGRVPLDLPGGRVGGDSVRTYEGADGAYYADRLKELTEVLGGPDIAFTPYLADDTHIRWRMQTGGDESNPYLRGAGVQRFEYSAPENGITGLGIEEDSSNMATRAFSISGSGDDDVLAGQYTDTYLTRNGWPLLEAAESRQNVTSLPLLDRYAREMAQQGRNPIETWTMSFARNERPFLSDYWVGDFADLNIVGHPWLEDGVYSTRIVGLKGNHADEKVDVTFMEGTKADVDTAGVVTT